MKNILILFIMLFSVTAFSQDVELECFSCETVRMKSCAGCNINTSFFNGMVVTIGNQEIALHKPFKVWSKSSLVHMQDAFGEEVEFRLSQTDFASLPQLYAFLESCLCTSGTGVGTDDQLLSLIGNTLVLENGGSVSLASFLDNTDDQTITDFSLTGNTLSMTLEGGNTETVDLSAFLNTDDQQISLIGNILTLEDGGTVNLMPYLDNTDDQQITTFDYNAVSGIVTLTLEDGGTQTIDLSSLAGGTDDQVLGLTGTTLTLEDGGSVDLSVFFDNTDNQMITDLSINGANILSLTLEDGGTETVDLSQLIVPNLDNDPTNELDDTDISGVALSLTGTTLTVTVTEDGVPVSGSISLASLQDGTGTDNQQISLATNIITLESGGSVSLAPYLDNTDDQQITAFGFNNATNQLTITIEDGNTETVDLSTLATAGSDNQQLSLVGSVLTLEDGGSVTLPSGDTDISGVTLAFDGTTLTTTVTEDGVNQSDNINLSSLQGTDDQFISNFAITSDALNITLEDGGSATVSLLPYLDDTNPTALPLSLAGTVLSVGVTEDGVTLTNTVDLSTIDTDTQLTEAQVDAFANNNGYLLTEVDGSITNEIQDVTSTDGSVTIVQTGNDFNLSVPAGSDNQALTLAIGNILTLEDGGTVDLTSFLDNTDTQDLSLVGNVLSLTDGGSVTLPAGAISVVTDLNTNTNVQNIASHLDGNGTTVNIEESITGWTNTTNATGIQGLFNNEAGINQLIRIDTTQNGDGGIENLVYTIGAGNVMTVPVGDLFNVTAGTTAAITDDALGSANITTGSTLHFVYPNATIPTTVTQGSAIINMSYGMFDKRHQLLNWEVDTFGVVDHTVMNLQGNSFTFQGTQGSAFVEDDGHLQNSGAHSVYNGLKHFGNYANNFPSYKKNAIAQYGDGSNFAADSYIHIETDRSADSQSDMIMFHLEGAFWSADFNNNVAVINLRGVARQNGTGTIVQEILGVTTRISNVLVYRNTAGNMTIRFQITNTQDVDDISFVVNSVNVRNFSEWQVLNITKSTAATL